MLSHPGLKRERNEDSMAWREPDVAHDLLHKGYVFVVADGVGGRQAGEIASQYIADRMVERYYQSPTPDTRAALAESIKLVNEELLEKASQEQGQEGMATTLLAAVVKGGKLFLANVGDCRAYLIRDQRIEQLTEDHSFAAELVRVGRISKEEAVEHPQRGVVTRYLGAEEVTEPDIFERDIQAGDIIVLCSDGLWSQLADEEISEIVTGDEPARAVNVLIDRANQRGGTDNVTAIVLRVEVRVDKPVSFRQRLKSVILNNTSRVGESSPQEEDKCRPQAEKGAKRQRTLAVKSPQQDAYAPHQRSSGESHKQSPVEIERESKDRAHEEAQFYVPDARPLRPVDEDGNSQQKRGGQSSQEVPPPVRIGECDSASEGDRRVDNDVGDAVLPDISIGDSEQHHGIDSMHNGPTSYPRE